jgi:16S rRNA (guanine1207-N2)-methyltransferase
MLVTTAREADLSPWFDVISPEENLLVAQRPRAGQHTSESFTYGIALAGRQLEIQSEPGIFSPRSLDPGTRELLQLIQTQPGQRFLDLGCGAGAVSLVASQVWGCQVTAVDVSARALRLTRQNAPEAEVLASDGFSALTGRVFDLIASNPPYHTDFAVAKGFIEGAYRHLAPGGWLYLVVKRADWYVQKTRAVFGGCRAIEREGYVIIAAEKRARDSAAASQGAESRQATTRKHAKRMAASGHHKPRR